MMSFALGFSPEVSSPVQNGQRAGFPPLPPGAPPPLPPGRPPPLPPEPPPLPHSMSMPSRLTGRRSVESTRRDGEARRSIDRARIERHSTDPHFHSAWTTSPLTRRRSDSSIGVPPPEQQLGSRVLDSLEWVLRQHVESMRNGQIEFGAADHDRARLAAALCEQLAFHIRAQLPPQPSECRDAAVTDAGCMLPNGIASSLEDLLGGSQPHMHGEAMF